MGNTSSKINIHERGAYELVRSYRNESESMFYWRVFGWIIPLASYVHNSVSAERPAISWFSVMQNMRKTKCIAGIVFGVLSKLPNSNLTCSINNIGRSLC